MNLFAQKRYSEMEPFMRRTLEVLIAFTRESGHAHSDLQKTAVTYANHLIAFSGLTEREARQRLAELGVVLGE